MDMILKFVVISKKTPLEELIYKYNTIEQAKFYITHLGEDFSFYTKQHQRYVQSLEETISALTNYGKVQRLDRQYLPNFIFGEDDIVVVVGQDGLVANTMKYLKNQIIVAVNPDKSIWDGVLLPFIPSDIKKIIPELIKGKRDIKNISMAKVSLADGQVLYGVNDLFIGQKTHTSARYTIRLGDYEENQSSSGIIISTGLGSTGWLKSIISGAVNISEKFSIMKKNSDLSNCDNQNKKDDDNKNIYNNEKSYLNMSWDSTSLVFSVREPFPSKSSKANLVFGVIENNKSLKIISKMPENGVIFSDGVESDFLTFSSGMEAKISLSKRKGHLVV
jgi:hypothetical protein